MAQEHGPPRVRLLQDNYYGNVEEDEEWPESDEVQARRRVAQGAL